MIEILLIFIQIFPIFVNHKPRTHQLRARMALSLFNDVPLRTRRALLPYILYTVLSPLRFSAEYGGIVIMPFWLSTDEMQIVDHLLYCKRCYFRVTKFSRLAAQKHIRGLLNSRWADAHLSFWYCKYFCGFLNSRLLNLREIREN